ncbi:MAG: RNA polymerase sigma factor [Bacteroidetes bacterium]|nr:MAG: RNA polymerase sigma factor [Bacteroidota bacterium]
MKLFSDNNQTDEVLMQQITKGNKQAFELLYERYFDKLVWFCMQLVADKTAAEDVVQEVFMVLIERPHLYEKGKKLSTWMYSIAANKSKNVLRNQANRLRLLDEEIFTTSTTQQGTIDSNKMKGELQQLLSSCSEKEKILFVLRFEHELPIKEIAEITAMPEGSVKSGLYYLIKKIGKHLKVFTHD